MSTNEGTVKFELTEAQAKLLLDNVGSLVRDLRVGGRASELNKVLTALEVQAPPHLGGLSEKFADLQESEVGGWALTRLLDQATEEVVESRRNGSGGVSWSGWVVRRMEAFALLLDVSYSDVNGWVSDVSFDQATEQLADERNAE